MLVTQNYLWPKTICAMLLQNPDINLKKVKIQRRTFDALLMRF